MPMKLPGGSPPMMPGASPIDPYMASGPQPGSVQQADQLLRDFYGSDPAAMREMQKILAETMGPAQPGGMGAPEMQQAPQQSTDPSVLRDIMAAGELAKQGMMQEAKQLYDQAMLKARQLKQQPMVQEGIGMMQQVPGMAEDAMNRGAGMAEDAMNRGAGMAEDAYGAVKGLFK